VCGQAFFRGDEVHDGWIDIARAGPHIQTLQRRHAHRSVHTAATPNGRSRAAIAQVERDYMSLFFG